ncbi:hypothetical protein [Arsenophonus nasoniae]|uniref:hypothetical protein n=1 Tax=Arsenophonus nasoniae TaxID=638 RepID=UPI00387A0560
MSDLINKTILIEEGLTICKPSIYGLSIIDDKQSGKLVRISHSGNNIIEFPLTEIQCRALARKLMD